MNLSSYTSADLIADFISEKCSGTAFLVTGGACAFIVDAIGRNSESKYVCFQHEQSAAMAADAVWRTTGKIGVTVATSGPGATNLITGIACSWFDSIPSIHITGQVNQNESREALNANVRQAGFQETDIVSMVKPITKYAKKIESVEDLIETLPQIIAIATTGRMGPVLLDIPMNIQKAPVTAQQKKQALQELRKEQEGYSEIDFKDVIESSKRPVVLIGAGAALSGATSLIQKWCEESRIPYVSSWGAQSYIDRSGTLYFGSIGVYGSRKANWLVQSADKILVLGSRLDNRQRTGNPDAFAPFAEIHVFDVDEEELKKYERHGNYICKQFDLRNIEKHLTTVEKNRDWSESALQSVIGMDEGFGFAVEKGQFNPYNAVRIIQTKFEPNSIVVSDCGANLCWVYQSYLPDSSFLFTAGGNSPMGYSLPAAIGAQIENPNKKVYCFIGDGGLQMNIQELQTIVAYNLPITIFIQNNYGYGIIKQFQDAYFEGRHFASGEGYSIPDFEAISKAYRIPYFNVDNEVDLRNFQIPSGFSMINLQLPPESLITPKTEMNRFIHDQYPYINDDSISRLFFEYPNHPSQIDKTL
jgi:acetolactate synthase-1/2/3 large subunit